MTRSLFTYGLSRIATVGVTALFHASALHAQSAVSHVADRCPLPADVAPWTIVARSESPLADQRFLLRTVRAIAREFAPTEPIRATPRTTAEWELAEPLADSTFQRDKWRPGDSDRATVKTALHADGHWSPPQLVTSEGDIRVTQAALAAVTRASAAVPARRTDDILPRAFAAARPTDSLVVRLAFGEPPRAGEQAVARFAMQEVEVEPAGRPVKPVYPESMRREGFEGTVVAQFLVAADGVPDTTVFSARPDADPAFVASVRDALGRQRFHPAQVDCRPVPRVVQQRFDFQLGVGNAAARRTR